MVVEGHVRFLLIHLVLLILSNVGERMLYLGCYLKGCGMYKWSTDIDFFFYCPCRYLDSTLPKEYKQKYFVHSAFVKI